MESSNKINYNEYNDIGGRLNLQLSLYIKLF